MNTDRIQNMGDQLAKTISFIFHPLLVPLYGLLIIFSAPTLIGFLPFEVKEVIFLIILINNVLIPLSLVLFFKFRKLISTYTLDDRKERNVPLLLTCICYMITTYILFKFRIPVFFKSYILAVLFLAISITLVNFWWKISIHSAGAGAMAALVIVLSFKMSTTLTWFLIPIIIIGGLILTSRLWLNAHNPSQTWWGYIMGFCISGLSLMIFQ